MTKIKGSPRRSTPDAGLIEEFIQACREMSRATICFHSAVGERLGLNSTDHKCAEWLLKRGPMSAGQLAKLSGLSTGAITGVVDRLVSAGMVQRQPDPRDRRRVVLSVAQDCEARVAPLFAGIAQGTSELCARYTPEQLRLIMQFMHEASAVSLENAEKLLSAPEPASKKAEPKPAAKKRAGRGPA